MVGLKIKLKKQAEKYLSKCDKSAYNKIVKALKGLENLDGDIVRLQGRDSEFRLKIPPYRIIFEYVAGNDIIMVTKISPRGDAYK
jgi:mRNA-degrading endonuclease RelE of RelBE toxin-antitoxin system